MALEAVRQQQRRGWRAGNLKRRGMAICVSRPVPEDLGSDIEDRDEALQLDLTEAERSRKPRVEACSERGVLASLGLGLLVRGLFTIRVADPLGLHDQPVYTDIPVSQAAIPDLSCRNLYLQLCRGPPGNGASSYDKREKIAKQKARQLAKKSKLKRLLGRMDGAPCTAPVDNVAALDQLLSSSRDDTASGGDLIRQQGARSHKPRPAARPAAQTEEQPTSQPAEEPDCPAASAPMLPAQRLTPTVQQAQQRSSSRPTKNHAVMVKPPDMTPARGTAGSAPDKPALALHPAPQASGRAAKRLRQQDAGGGQQQQPTAHTMAARQQPSAAATAAAGAAAAAATALQSTAVRVAGMVRAKTAGKKADSNGKQLGSEQLGGKQLKGKQLESKEGPAQASVGQASRPLSRMQRLMSQAAQHKADMAAARQAPLWPIVQEPLALLWLQEEAARAAHSAYAQQAQKGRQQQKQAFFKRTRTGQPLMRYRVEKILQALQS
ncbi:hypothetical protein QJQ45_011581 [Haematococcus lacustris]|nr:hypothetical protein QJQ45_011581 [Haematococcus lacustris]